MGSLTFVFMKIDASFPFESARNEIQFVPLTLERSLKERQ